MKGDRVEVVVDAGDSIRVYDITATRAGRRVEITTGRGVVEVTERERQEFCGVDVCAVGFGHALSVQG